MVVAKPAITTLGMTAGKTKMNKLEELIKELCPDGVEYRKLKDASIMQRGTSLTKANSIEGEFPVISGGKEPAFYCNQYNRDGETITVAGSGAGAGFVQYWTIPLFANDCFTLKAIENNSTKYVYYFLTSIQNKINDTKKGGGVPHVHISDIENFEIPIPPLEVQKEIVRILDSFTELEKELEKELAARKKQYEYYRDSLLTFETSVEWKTIKELFDTRNGYTPSTSNSAFWDNGTIPWFVMDDIRTNGRVLSDSKQHITPAAVKGSRLFKKNSIIVATSATIGEHALITTDFLSNQRFTCLSPKEEFESKIDMKFIFYYSFILDDFCKNNTTVSSFASVDMRKFYDFKFPLPPLAEQERIVSILDRFDSLCNSLTSGLPAEIEARRRQYQYYRDKLLSFKRC